MFSLASDPSTQAEADTLLWRPRPRARQAHTSAVLCFALALLATMALSGIAAADPPPVDTPPPDPALPPVTVAPSTNKPPPATVTPSGATPVSAPERGPVAPEIFEALVGEHVTLTDMDGTASTGRLKAAAGEKLILILDDGKVVALATDAIVDVRVVASRGGTGAQALQSQRALPAECAQLPALLSKVQAADTKVGLAAQACSTVGDAVGSAVADQIGGLLGLGGIGRSLTKTAAQGAASAGCETAAESAIYEDLRERYDALVARCEGSGATPYVSSNAAVHATAAKRPKMSPYIQAVRSGDLEKAKKLLPMSTDVERSFQGECDLWYASKSGDLPMIRFLVETRELSSYCTRALDTHSVYSKAAGKGEVDTLALLMDVRPPSEPWSADSSWLSLIDRVAKIQGPRAREIQTRLETQARLEEAVVVAPVIGWNTRWGFLTYGLRGMMVPLSDSSSLGALDLWVGEPDQGLNGGFVFGGSAFSWDLRLYRSENATGQVKLNLGYGLEYREWSEPEDPDFPDGDTDLVCEFGVIPISLEYGLHINGSSGIDLGVQMFFLNVTEDEEVSFLRSEDMNLYARLRFW